MADRREGILIAFALRFLKDNLESDVMEAINADLTIMEVPPLLNDEELGEIADTFCGEIP